MKETKKTTKGNVRFVPEGFSTVNPFILVEDAQGLIKFIENVFGGKQIFISKDDNNQIIHSTVQIGNSRIMIADTMGTMEPETGMLFLYFDDVDNVYKKAIAAKATKLQDVKDQFWGDRAGGVRDQWGNKWWIATHIEDVDDEEQDRRARASAREREKEPAHA